MTNDTQMECAVLGAMLQTPQAFAIGRELEPIDFTLDSHRRIFNRMLAMEASGIGVDGVTLLSELMRTKELDTVGGAGYVADLDAGLPRNFNPAEYAKILRKRTLGRSIVNVCEIARSRIEGGDEPDDVLAELSGNALRSQMTATDVRPLRISECVMPVMEELARQRSCKREVLGVATGIAALDEVTTGWRGGELTYLGALPGRGKTSFMLQAMYAAARAGVGVGCISLEMRASQLIKRLAILHSGLHASKLRDARQMNDAEYEKAKRSVLALGEMPISIVDQSGLSAGKIASLARQMYEAGARIIFVDFVQIIREDGKDRREAINRVSASLRDTCKMLNIPFVVASQLARRGDDINRRPTMQDLRESGSLEQDAHCVLLLYRPTDKDGEWTREDQIIIAKQREGVTGHVDVEYDDQALVFRERSPADRRRGLAA